MYTIDYAIRILYSIDRVNTDTMFSMSSLSEIELSASESELMESSSSLPQSSSCSDSSNSGSSPFVDSEGETVTMSSDSAGDHTTQFKLFESELELLESDDDSPEEAASELSPKVMMHLCTKDPLSLPSMLCY